MVTSFCQLMSQAKMNIQHYQTIRHVSIVKLGVFRGFEVNYRHCLKTVKHVDLYTWNIEVP